MFSIGFGKQAGFLSGPRMHHKTWHSLKFLFVLTDEIVMWAVFAFYFDNGQKGKQL